MKGFPEDFLLEKAYEQLDIPFNSLPITYGHWIAIDFLFHYHESLKFK